MRIRHNYKRRALSAESCNELWCRYTGCAIITLWSFEVDVMWRHRRPGSVGSWWLEANDVDDATTTCSEWVQDGELRHASFAHLVRRNHVPPGHSPSYIVLPDSSPFLTLFLPIWSITFISAVKTKIWHLALTRIADTRRGVLTLTDPRRGALLLKTVTDPYSGP